MEEDLLLASYNFYDLDLKKIANGYTRKNTYVSPLQYFIKNPYTGEVEIICDQEIYDYLMTIKNDISNAKKRCKKLHYWTLYFNDRGCKDTKTFYDIVRNMNIELYALFCSTFLMNSVDVTNLMTSLNICSDIVMFYLSICDISTYKIMETSKNNCHLSNKFI